jgi:hypothetical protein
MTLQCLASHRASAMSFRDPASLDDSTFLGRIAARLVERFVLPFTDTFATSAMAVLAVPVGCVSIAVATIGAGILTFFLPDALTGRVLAGGLIVGILAAVGILVEARSRFRKAVRRTADVRFVKPAGALSRDPRFLAVRDRARARVAARRVAVTARLADHLRSRRTTPTTPTLTPVVLSDSGDPGAGGPRPT